ncbi:MAG TPA: hypothetical protein VFM65_03215 [Flavobacteriaceae bacterium]|nr:hypothetical protein [Flavobacteriaceae bacterium]
MKGELKREGKYELFKTSRGHQIINLGDEYYALVKGQKGDIIVKSDADHEKDKTLFKGKYYYADFKNDPDFQDTPHLFLEDGDQFQEMILPEGFPEEKDYQKKLVRTEKKLSKEKVLRHVK